MHNLKPLALANPGNLDILKSIIKINLIQATQKNVESRRLSCCAGSVREKIEMSEQQLVSAHEVNASPLEEQPMAEQAVLSEENATAQQPAAPQTHPAADEAGPVVKLLSVGQELHGTVKRITEFGAFVDIGVGRDGLIHISELSTTRVAKVTDVLQEGQPITLWIKKLDRDRNRISLTMIEPGKRTIRDLQVGEIVQGTVTRLLPYGAFIDIGVGRDALLHVREMSNSFVAKPEDVVKIGDSVEVRILEVARRRNRIDLSMKGLRPEPEVQLPEAVAHEEVVDTHEPEETAEERFDEIEALTTMQMAFRKAQERSGVNLPLGKNKKQRRTQAAHKRAAQDDIIERTLGGQTNRK
jgi:ribosomal protein S1